MDIFFRDSSEIPLPPEEVRIREININPSADGRRLKVYIEVDPFQKRPSARLRVISSTGREIASAEIIETMIRKMELNLHLRGELDPGQYVLDVEIYYADLPEPGQTDAASVDREIVDTAQQKFILE
jgi:hypothetical protein